MKVYFDNIIFFLQKKGGVSRYWWKITSTLKSIEITNHEDLNCSNNIYAQNSKKLGLCFFPKKILRYLPVVILKYADIFHSSYYRVGLNLNPFCKMKSVVTVHDFMYEIYESGFKKFIHSLQKRISIQFSDAVICVSENTMNDFMKYYPNYNNPVYVIHNGVDEELFSEKSLMQETKLKLPEKYFLYVGNRFGCKNFSFVLNSFNESKFLQQNSISLVCVGGEAFSSKELKEIHEAGLQEYIFHFPLVLDNDLFCFYRDAEALLVPSEYEGFGIPAIEAQALSCIVIDSGTSSLPEVVGYNDFRYLHNCTASFLSKCHLVISGADVNRVCILKGKEFAKRFSWEEAARKTHDVYEGLIRDCRK